MRLFRSISLSVLLLFSVVCSAQSIITVNGTYTHYAPQTMSLLQAKNEAVQQAKLHLIADKFGTVISSSTITNIANVNGQASSSTSTFGESEVKGEWIETIGEPSFDKIDFIENSIAITVSIKGKVREIKSSQVDMSVKLLSNAQDSKSECYDFHDGQSFYLQFTTPVKGYLAVYLFDNQDVYRLLPFMDSEEGAVEVKASKTYTFFDGVSTDEMVFTTSESQEVDRIYVVFSKNPFTKALDTIDKNNTLSVPVQKWGDFQKWLGKCRSHDADMTVKAFYVTITK